MPGRFRNHELTVKTLIQLNEIKAFKGIWRYASSNIVAEACGIKAARMRSIKKDIDLMSEEELQLLAKYFGVREKKMQKLVQVEKKQKRKSQQIDHKSST